MVTVVPRRGEATGAAGRGADEACAAAFATGAGADCGARACKSSLRIRPPIPVPRTVARLIPSSLASLRTIGVT